LQIFIQLLAEAGKVNLLFDRNIIKTLLSFKMVLSTVNKTFLQYCDINTVYHLGNELRDPLDRAKLCKLLADSGNIRSKEIRHSIAMKILNFPIYEQIPKKFLKGVQLFRKRLIEYLDSRISEESQHLYRDYLENSRKNI
jgi:hypothetical protein